MNQLSLVYNGFKSIDDDSIYLCTSNQFNYCLWLNGLHIVGKGIIETPWTTPAPLGAALGCMDFKAAIMVIGLIILDMVLYYPFFKLLENKN